MQTILFDLDGTLIDHFSAIHRSVAHAQKQLGLPESDYATVRATVGGSVPVTLGRLMGPERVDEALPHFREFFNRIMLEDVAELPGVSWLLQSLKAEGYTLGVLTNKFGDHSRAILEHLGLAPWLDAIVGTDDVPYRKPDPEFTRHILDLLGADDDSSCLIGDSPFDFAAADVIPIPAYLVATGSHSVEQLQAETTAAGIYEDMYDLGRQLFGLEPQKVEA